MPIVRNSFVQVVKLHNVKGRISYISSRAKQENLYAVYETTERKFWRELAQCNQEDFARSGTDGKCIEARELIIALPKSLTDYQPDLLLKIFTEQFKQKYNVECISALHHNKRKTNYHIHLIFSERRLLEKPIEKVATRNMYYDEKGKHVRTKKEVVDENGELREGCSVIRKGEIYERNIFSSKDAQFKSNKYPDEVKVLFTDLINLYVKNSEERLQIFDKNGAYLPTKKIGKNNPKAQQIEADNEMRKKWNQTVDRALISGIPETQIVEIKEKEIGRKARDSIQRIGKNPALFKNVIQMAIAVLELLITKVFIQPPKKAVAVMHQESEKRNVIEKPKCSVLAAKYPRLVEIYNKLEHQNHAIHQQEQTLLGLEKELANARGIFKGKQRKELQEKIEDVTIQIDSMKRYLSGIVKRDGYKNVKEFMLEYSIAKKEHNDYQNAVAKWEEQTGEKAETRSIRERLQQKQQEVKEKESKGGQNKQKLSDYAVR